MKKLRNVFAVALLVVVVLANSVSAKTGLLVSDFTSAESQTCSEVKDDSEKVDSGILVTFTGILVTLTGILVTVTDDGQVNCGIVMSDN